MSIYPRTIVLIHDATKATKHSLRSIIYCAQPDRRRFDRVFGSGCLDISLYSNTRGATLHADASAPTGVERREGHAAFPEGLEHNERLCDLSIVSQGGDGRTARLSAGESSKD